MVTIADIVSDAMLEHAYGWLCTRRQHWPPDADVWRFRQRWPAEKAQLRADLAGGTYTVGLLTRVALQNGAAVDLWVSRDVCLYCTTQIYMEVPYGSEDRPHQ